MDRYRHTLTIWSTPDERCEIVWGGLRGYRVRVRTQEAIACEELLTNIHAAIRRALEFRPSRPLVPLSRE